MSAWIQTALSPANKYGTHLAAHPSEQCMPEVWSTPVPKDIVHRAICYLGKAWA